MFFFASCGTKNGYNCTGRYRFSFNGKEDETWQVQDFDARMYDKLACRWLSIDPVVHPYQSPFAAFANNPIYYTDPTGTTADDYQLKDDGSWTVIKRTGKDHRFFDERGKEIKSTDLSLGRWLNDKKLIEDMSQGGKYKGSDANHTIEHYKFFAGQYNAQQLKPDEFTAVFVLLGIYWGVKGVGLLWNAVTKSSPQTQTQLKPPPPPAFNPQTSPFYQQLSRQFAKDGVKSIQKTLSSLEKRLAEHQTKLPNLQYKSSVEREIRTFKEQIEIAKQFMKDNNITP